MLLAMAISSRARPIARRRLGNPGDQLENPLVGAATRRVLKAIGAQEFKPRRWPQARRS